MRPIAGRRWYRIIQFFFLLGIVGINLLRKNQELPADSFSTLA